MKKSIFLFAALACLSCQPFTKAERRLISEADSLMSVTEMPADSIVLHTPCRDLNARELASPLLKALVDKMHYTVRHPSQDGVGIAAPQVGISRRVIWVQRFDKPGEPFECYLNPHLDSLGGDVLIGPEGCLSVPPYRGMVPRHSEVTVSYLRPDSRQRIREHVQGYTAIIFQHELDHLDGRLYTSRALSVSIDSTWAAQRLEFSAR